MAHSFITASVVYGQSDGLCSGVAALYPRGDVVGLHLSYGKVFKNIGEVKGFGTSNEKQIYTFTDADPLSIIGYYRLCQVDMGGNKTYSKTLAVSFESKNTLTLFPNPATNQITLQVDKAVDVTITVFDRMGRMVLQTKSTDSRMDLDISHLQAGTYWARVTTPKESLQRAFVKQ